MGSWRGYGGELRGRNKLILAKLIVLKIGWGGGDSYK